jgi:6-phosphogluconolactonase/glucosamine-6-phosphate isomerase/deaminase
MRCNCPYVVCPIHGNCAACVAKSRGEGTLAHCMEETAQALGAKLPVKIPATWLERDYEAMSLRSARLVAEAVREKPDALISLPAGMTAARTFELIREMADAGEADFSRARFVALDEWLDLGDERENCNAFMMANFYGPMGIAPERITRFDVHAADLEAECRRVDGVVFARGGIDLMLLGAGMNGHLGLNEPGGDFSRYSKVVGQKYFSEGMKLTRGITLGVRHMFDARKVVLQIGGSHKAEIVEKIYRSAPTEKIPATVLKLLPRGVVVLDQDAASGIRDLLGEPGAFTPAGIPPVR